MIVKLNNIFLDKITNIHLKSWEKYEISIKLGEKIIRQFYSNVINSDFAFCYIYLDGDHIVGYATGFNDYIKFNNYFNKGAYLQNSFLVFRKLLFLELSLYDLINIINKNRIMENLCFPNHHLGAFALSNEYKKTSIGKFAITSTINQVLEKLEKQFCNGCWSVCDERNIPVIKIHDKFNFKKVRTVNFIKKNLLVYEKSF